MLRDRYGVHSSGLEGLWEAARFQFLRTLCAVSQLVGPLTGVH